MLRYISVIQRDAQKVIFCAQHYLTVGEVLMEWIKWMSLARFAQGAESAKGKGDLVLLRNSCAFV